MDGQPGVMYRPCSAYYASVPPPSPCFRRWIQFKPGLARCGTPCKSAYLYWCRSQAPTSVDHRATVATAPGENLLIGRRPVRTWTRRTISVLCRKLHLFLGKSTKTAATRAALFDFDMHQIVCRLGLCPRSHWGSLQRPPRPPSCI